MPAPDTDILVVEQIIAAFRRGDVEAMLDLNHPEGEFVNPDYAIEPGTRRGREEVAQAIGRLREFFEDIEVESIERTPDGQLLVISRVRTRGVGGSPGIEDTTGILFTVRDGLVMRYEWFRSPDEARAAAGLSSHDPG